MVLSFCGILLAAYFIFIQDRDDMVYLLIVSILILVISYTFQYQINQLMIRGVPQRLDRDMRAMLEVTSPHFKALSEPQKRMAEDRMQRWVMQKDFINKNEQDAPEDVKYILAWYASLLTLHQEDYLYKGIDRVVFYHHPFLSPHHQDDVHILELEQQDGTLIISVPHLIKGHMEKGIYNIGLHVMAEAYAFSYIKDDIQWPPDIWDHLESISTIPRDRIEDYIGLKQLDPWAVAVHHQATYAGTRIPQVVEQIPTL
jgi:hypothetical protein